MTDMAPDPDALAAAGLAPADPPADPAAPPVEEGEWTPPTRDEWDKQQKAIAAANKRSKALETAAEKAKREEQEKAGEYEGLWKAERERAAKLEQGIKTAALESALVAAAGRLGYRNPQLAKQLVSTDGIDVNLDSGTPLVDSVGQADLERRLSERLAADPYLKGEPARPQLAGAGDAPVTSGGGNEGFNQSLRASLGR